MLTYEIIDKDNISIQELKFFYILIGNNINYQY